MKNINKLINKFVLSLFLAALIITCVFNPYMVSADNETPAEINTELPLAGSVRTSDNRMLYIINISEYIPAEADWKYQFVNEQASPIGIACLKNADSTVYYLYLCDENENIYMYAYNSVSGQLLPAQEIHWNGDKYYSASAYVVNKWPEGLSDDIVNIDGIFYAMDMQGKGAFYMYDEHRNLVEWTAEQYNQNNMMDILVAIMVIAVIIIVILIVLVIRADNVSRKRRKRVAAKRKKELERGEDKEYASAARKYNAVAIDGETEDSGSEYLEFIDDKDEAQEVTDSRKPVIQVKGVTMRFKISMNNVSGIKEYIIQAIKKNITYRELLALDNVSFDVYKGEVVGIIGTNGSGKSTLLRIVSGALKPSEGEVIADKKKIQLLTLGTGFDAELTARENVYLNGAIIGYSKEFIDANYQKIVEFAELENFMEEKVKNFSSGMVSRLGFAIATVGDAADILILDEVLSVGDEFFRKKSLARVKEMIHGGSTVLMVSHGMGTILEHCSKVIWIEKGVLRMVGDPKKVCAAYRNQNEKFTGLDTSADNEWYYLKDGQIDRTFEGLYRHTDGKLYYISNGIVDFEYTGIQKYSDGKLYYLNNGQVDTKSEGLCPHVDGKLYYVINGIVETKFTGRVRYKNNKLYYVKDGFVDDSFTAIVRQSDGEEFYVRRGVVMNAYTGLVKDDNGKYCYIEDGKPEYKFSGLVRHKDEKIYYVQNGYINFKYTGLVKHSDGRMYYITNGIFNMNFTGAVEFEGRKWQIKKGMA